MAGSPKKRARRLRGELKAPSKRLQDWDTKSLIKMRKRGATREELLRCGMNAKNVHRVMAAKDERCAYVPTEPERRAVLKWVIAGYGHPLKIKEMLLEDYDVDIPLDSVKECFRVEFALGKERVAVKAAENVVAAIEKKHVGVSLKYLESSAKWNRADDAAAGGGDATPPPPSPEAMNVTTENASAVYMAVVKGAK